MIQPATDALQRDLVSRTNAEGIIALAVGAVIAAGGEVLLLEDPNRDFDDPFYWTLPAATVHPGETLLDALDRGLATHHGVGLDVDEITGYLGSYDHDTGADLVRFFAFTATVSDHRSVCRNSRIAHNWIGPTDPAAVTPDVRCLLDSYFATAEIHQVR